MLTVNNSKPPESQWTDDQWKAISMSGQDMLVAAAAGSGKTAVLVERIIRKISRLEDPVDVDRLLVVTFTNASAQEMRNRIGEALEKSLTENPDSVHLRRQLSLLNRASISTIHSFCLNVIQEYYYELELDPAFRIANEIEMDLLIEEVLDDLFEEQYSISENESFFDLIDRFSSDRDDTDVQKLIRELYRFSRAHPFPQQWLADIIESYDVKSVEKIDELPFYPYLKNDIQLKLTGAKSTLEQAFELTKVQGGPYPRAKNIENDLNQLDRLLKSNASSWQHLYEDMQAVSFTRAASCRGEEFDKELLDKWTKLRNQAKKQVETIRDELFKRKPENYLKDMLMMKPVIETLIQLVQEFTIRFQASKREKGLVDFADLEHYCLEILQSTESEPDKITPSDAALSYRNQFEEVLVDEYQDVNLVQEMILKLVTKESEIEGNFFMVGDVKQSIYRFRLAEPLLFLTKYKRFTVDGAGSGLKIDLSKNFRSRTEVLDATNFLFKQIMGETVGEIDYDEDAALKLGADYPESDGMKAEVLLINKAGPLEEETSNDESQSEELVEFDQAELETVQLEARLMAKKITELIQGKFQVYDKKLNQTRNITYRDIVILLRSMPWAPQIMEEFKQQGIPVYAELSTGYFEATEVSIMLSLLRVLDNPYQDIHLASVLRSPIVGLNPDELAILRIHHKKGSYYEALTSFVKNRPKGEREKTYEKAVHFTSRLEEWRTFARTESLPNLIWKLYRDTQFYDFVGGMPGGKGRQANLRALYDRARQYESTSLRGLFKFLRFVDRMQDRGEDLGEARAIGEQEDVVRLMTIHKSKGLEFPVVFIGGLSKQFNMQDLNKMFLLDKDLGFASKFVNPVLRISYPTLPQITLKQKMKLELIAEEMRVLYVALTRAKEKLFLIGTVKDAERSFEKWETHLANEEWLLPDFLKLSAKSYLDWIGPALIRHRDFPRNQKNSLIRSDVFQHPSKWEIRVMETGELKWIDQSKEEVEKNILHAVEEGEEVKIVSDYMDDVVRQLNWHYFHQDAASKRSKQTVSEIKRQREYIDEHSDTILLKKSSKLIAKRPKFMQEKALTPAEKGTATHMLMQHIPFTHDVSRESLSNLLAKMVVDELLTDEQADVIEMNSIMAFFKTNLATRLINATKISREVPFSLGLDASEAYSNWNRKEKEKVLIQGVIDCIFEDDEGIVLLDYKTDTITGKYHDANAALKILKERYQVQIELYTKALESILKKPITEKYLYFFDGGHLVKM